MGKIKLYDVAKELNLTSKEVLEIAKKLNIEAKSHLSSIDEADANKIKESVKNLTAKKPEKKMNQEKTKKEEKNDSPVIIRREVIINDEANVQKEQVKKEEKTEKIEAKKTVDDGTYKIVMATAPSQSLTVDGGKTGNGANVHLWQYVNSEQQQFNLVYDGKGYYEITPIHSGKRLDVAGWGNEANVDQWQQNGGNDNQKWIIYKNSKGNYNIISKRQKLYLRCLSI